MKKYFIKFIVVLLLFAPAIAQEKVKTTGVIKQNNNLVQDNKRVSFQISKTLNLKSGITIPENSIITVEIINIQDNRRWHKSAFLVSKLLGYIENPESAINTLEDQNIYFVIRKYEALDKKEVAKTVAEVGATTAASFVVPGVDIAYYFTKGMIKKKEGVTRFKSGVSTAYENSIFWFWLKGKSLDLDENCSIKLQEVDEARAQKLINQIEQRKEKKQKLEEKKQGFKEFMSY